MAGGEIRLAAALEDYFDGTEVVTETWEIAQPYPSFEPTAVVSGGLITLDTGGLRSIQMFTGDVRVFEARARLGDPDTGWGDIGFGGNGDQPPGDTTRLFITDDSQMLLTNTRDGGDRIRTEFPEIDTNLFHDYRIVARQDSTAYYVDGALIQTDTNQPMLPTWAWLFTLFPGDQIQVDWARVADYFPSGSFASCPIDAGERADWGSLAATTQTPTGTTVQFETRSSDDSVNWSVWVPLGPGSAIDSPDARYLQYRITMTTNDATVSPQVDDVTVYYLVLPTTPMPTPTPTNTPTSTPTSTPAPPTPTPTNTATPTNTPVPPTPTPTPTPGANYALSFDGSNDIVRAAQVPGTGPLTIEAWVRPDDNNANGLLVIGADDYNGWSLELNGGLLTLWLSTNQGWQYSQNIVRLQPGQWYHVAATYENGAARTFVNGTGSALTNAGALTQGPLVRIGGFGGYPFFDGTVDEVRISNVVRYTSNFAPPTAPFSPDANTLSLWHFDEGAGQTASDASASANYGTLGNNGGVDNADPTWVGGYPQ
jgi:hypothetical protein